MLIHADARQIPLADGCVQCCVTSPPYFGLRDYGTARWDGGDPDCDHRHQLGGEGTSSAKQNTSSGTQTLQYRDMCAKCGARRIDQQIGLEPSPDAYVAALVGVFREVGRVLADDGVLWLNLGDSYAGGGGYSADAPSNMPEALAARSYHGSNKERLRRPGGIAPSGAIKIKDLVGIPWRVAFALQADGWYLRSDIIWSKPNPMPESVTDRPTKAHEYVFLLAKRERYFYDADAIREELQSFTGESGWARAYRSGLTRNNEGNGETSQGHPGTRTLGFNPSGRNKRSVWHIPTLSYAGAHFATMPEALIEPCILAGSRFGDRILDPFMGSGTVGAVAERLGRRWVGLDLNPAYHALAKVRTAQRGLLFEVAGGCCD